MQNRCPCCETLIARREAGRCVGGDKEHGCSRGCGCLWEGGRDGNRGDAMYGVANAGCSWGPTEGGTAV